MPGILKLYEPTDGMRYAMSCIRPYPFVGTVAGDEKAACSAALRGMFMQSFAEQFPFHRDASLMVCRRSSTAALRLIVPHGVEDTSL